MSSFKIVSADPQGADALLLLREAAIEARALYPEHFTPNTPWPGNPPTPSGGVYLLAYWEGRPVGCGALRPIDKNHVEVRRMFVTVSSRRKGLARVMLRELELNAVSLGYSVMRLETGNRQSSAAALYESVGFSRIAAFGEYIDDPLSLCFEKHIGLAGAGDE